MSKYPVEPYSPTRPEIFTASKVKVLSRFVLKPISCVFETGTHYVAVLANNASTLTQLNNLKITSINCSDEVDSYQCAVLSDALANTLQISQTLIDTVYKVTKYSNSINDTYDSQSSTHACLPPSDIPVLTVSTSYTQETPENNLRAIASIRALVTWTVCLRHASKKRLGICTLKRVSKRFIPRSMATKDLDCYGW
jgi:hypothetical protein